MNAYLDPASGSMLLSVIAGGAAGIAVFLKTFGHRLWSTLTFWRSGDAADRDIPAEGPPADSSVERPVS